MDKIKSITRYSSYKDSGISWIGKIPYNWTRTKLLNLLSSKIFDGPHETPTFVDKGIPFISIESLNDTESVDLTQCKKFISQGDYLSYRKKTNIHKGDILFTKAATIGKTAIVKDEVFMVWSPIAVIRTNSKKSFTKYIYHALGCNELIRHISFLGSYNTQLNVGMRELEQAIIPVPSLEEQQKIADYLDKKCGDINKVIETEKEVIEKLKEYKQSIITEAVTKGLDKSAPMKDSGITWIGQIPQHWGIVQLKVLFKFIGGYAFKSDDYVEETMNQIIRIGNIRNNKLILNEKQVYITDETAASAINMLIKKNDILFSMTGTKGKRDYFYTVLVQDEHLKNKKLYLNQRVGCFRKKIDIDERYFNYLLKENKILDSIFIYETGTANQGNLGIETIINTKLHYPSITEQKIISNYLDNKCTKIDKAIADKEQVIEKMTEYKKSLIYECVTGKRKVV